MLESPANVVARAKATINECTVSQMRDGVDPDTLLIDIREAAEYQRGHIPGAVLLPRGLLEFEIHPLVARASDVQASPPEDKPILLYCGTGGRSALAAKTLNDMGYKNVTSLDGGIVAWGQAGLPIETPGA
jgi:rhodanese-related sulfurtransferase